MTDDNITPAPERTPAEAAAPREGTEAPPGRPNEAVKPGPPPGAPSTAIQAGKPKAGAAAAEKGKPPAPEMKDGFREVVETVVFVVVLVLLLKGFLAEA